MVEIRKKDIEADTLACLGDPKSKFLGRGGEKVYGEGSKLAAAKSRNLQKKLTD